MNQKWQYYTAACYCKTVKKGGLFTRDEKQWVIIVDGKELPLDDGLTLMGENCWELVGIHKSIDYHGGQAPDWDFLSHIYVFKAGK